MPMDELKHQRNTPRWAGCSTRRLEHIKFQMEGNGVMCRCPCCRQLFKDTVSALDHCVSNSVKRQKCVLCDAALGGRKGGIKKHIKKHTDALLICGVGGCPFETHAVRSLDLHRINIHGFDAVDSLRRLSLCNHYRANKSIMCKALRDNRKLT